MMYMYDSENVNPQLCNPLASLRSPMKRLISDSSKNKDMEKYMHDAENVNPQFSNPLASLRSPMKRVNSDSSKNKEQERIGLIQLYYYNNYGGSYRHVPLEELKENTKEFLQEYREFRVPSDNDKVLLCFKRHDNSSTRYPQSSTFVLFESRESLRQFCIDNDVQYIQMGGGAMVWLSFHQVINEADAHAICFVSKEKIILEVGRGRLYHVPSKKVAKQLQNKLAAKNGIPLRL